MDACGDFVGLCGRVVVVRGVVLEMRGSVVVACGAVSWPRLDMCGSVSWTIRVEPRLSMWPRTSCEDTTPGRYVSIHTGPCA